MMKVLVSEKKVVNRLTLFGQSIIKVDMNVKLKDLDNSQILLPGILPT